MYIFVCYIGGHPLRHYFPDRDLSVLKVVIPALPGNVSLLPVRSGCREGAGRPLCHRWNNLHITKAR